MREINVSKVKEAVRDLFLKANFELRKDVLKAIKASVKHEKDPRAAGILKSIIENAALAKKKRLAICQDTGIAVVHMEIGQDVAFIGGALSKAVNDGVKEAYAKGYLRKSIVDDPILRNNTNTNTPCILLTEIIDGNKVKIDVSPKGFGSENKSRIKMFKPTASVEEIKEFVVETVKGAGPDACPPLFLGIGIGGTMEMAALSAKKALFMPFDGKGEKKHLRKLGSELMKETNAIGIGPMGFGGKTTVFGVNIVLCPTHIAGLPVAVNVSCHATRSASGLV
jgi:fumarate hydratase subunit alpha